MLRGFSQPCLKVCRALAIGASMKHPHEVKLSKVQYVDGYNGAKIAYRKFTGERAENGRLYLSGLGGTMDGEKSLGTEMEAQMRNRSCLRHDHQGQGLSSGTISLHAWLQDALMVLDDVCGKEQQVIVGSSVGAWLALHVALQRPQRVKALVLIAPAVDITGYYWSRLSEEENARAQAERRVPLRTQYQGPDDFLPLQFYQEGDQLQLLGGGLGSIAVECPIRILQGMQDTIVPYSCASKLLQALKTPDVHLTLIKDGDHRLSRPQDLSCILQTIQEMEDY